MRARKLAVLSSGGKDSMLMVHALLDDPAWRVVALVTTVHEDHGRVALHGTSACLLQAQADALGLPLVTIGLPENCSNALYEQRLARGLELLARAGVAWIACGDLHVDEGRAWREQSFARMGWKPVFPLWKRPCEQLLQQLEAEDWQLIITCVDTHRLSPDCLGQAYDRAFVDALPPDVDPCGEHGEFHSFVTRAPAYAQELIVRPGRRMLAHQRYLMLDLEWLPPEQTGSKPAGEA